MGPAPGRKTEQIALVDLDYQSNERQTYDMEIHLFLFVCLQDRCRMSRKVSYAA